MRVYRYAFILAAVAAAKPVLPAITEEITGHHLELIFGFLTVQLFGFLAAALPRWIGRPFAPAPMLPTLLVLHGVALYWSFAAPLPGLQARALLGAFGAIYFLGNVLAARAWSALPVMAFAGLHAGAGVVALFFPADETVAMRLGFGAIVLLCCEISTRIAIALVLVARERRGLTQIEKPPAWLSEIVRYGGVVTFGLWAFDGPYAVPALVSGLAGLTWLAQTRPLSVMTVPGLGVLLLGIFFMRAGFVVLALEGAGLAPGDSFLAVHFFAVGGLATLAIGIATSIVRRREATAFVRSWVATGAYATITVATLARLAASLDPAHYDSLIDAARWSFAAACGFYGAFIAKGLLEKDKKTT
jgi:uncharacterized protein involved in response to NO